MACNAPLRRATSRVTTSYPLTQPLCASVQAAGRASRRYILWRKLTRAMLAIGREGTIAAAAHAADFADAAHLTRTFYQMFGIPPSVMMRGEFFEVTPPFELAEAKP